jgi:ACS family tartrate transporter-like MFS transporter
LVSRKGAGKRHLDLSIYYLGVPLATIIAGPFSGLILDHMNGWGGLRGWQWLFLCQGFPAIIAAFVTLCFLTDSPQEAGWLTDEERISLIAVLSRDEQRSASHGHAALWCCFAGSFGTSSSC